MKPRVKENFWATHVSFNFGILWWVITKGGPNLDQDKEKAEVSAPVCRHAQDDCDCVVLFCIERVATCFAVSTDFIANFGTYRWWQVLHSRPAGELISINRVINPDYCLSVCVCGTMLLLQLWLHYE